MTDDESETQLLNSISGLHLNVMEMQEELSGFKESYSAVIEDYQRMAAADKSRYTDTIDSLTGKNNDLSRYIVKLERQLLSLKQELCKKATQLETVLRGSETRKFVSDEQTKNMRLLLEDTARVQDAEKESLRAKMEATNSENMKLKARVAELNEHVKAKHEAQRKQKEYLNYLIGSMEAMRKENMELLGQMSSTEPENYESEGNDALTASKKAAEAKLQETNKILAQKMMEANSAMHKYQVSNGKLQDAVQQLNTMHEEIRYLTEEAMRSSKAAAAAQAESEDLRLALRKQREDMQTMRALLDEKTTEITVLTSQLQLNKVNMKELNLKMTDDAGGYEAESAELKNEIMDLRKRTAAGDQYVRQLDIEYSNTLNELQQLKEKEGGLRSLIKEHETAKYNLTTELEQERFESRNMEECYDEKLRQKDEEISKLEMEKSNLLGEVDKLNVSLNYLEDQLQAARGEVESLTHKVGELERMSSQAVGEVLCKSSQQEEMIKMLEENVDTLKSQLDQTMQERDRTRVNLNKALDMERKKTCDFKAIIAQLRGEKQALYNSESAAKEELLKVSKELELCSARAAQDSEINYSETERLMVENSKLCNEKKKLGGILSDVITKANKLETSVIPQLERESAQKSAQIEKLVALVDEGNEKCAQLRTEAQAMNSKTKQHTLVLMAEIEKLRAKVQSLTNDAMAFDNRNEYLSHEFSGGDQDGYRGVRQQTINQGQKVEVLADRAWESDANPSSGND